MFLGKEGKTDPVGKKVHLDYNETCNAIYLIVTSNYWKSCHVAAFGQCTQIHRPHVHRFSKVSPDNVKGVVARDDTAQTVGDGRVLLDHDWLFLLESFSHSGGS
ncbi:unnamed protein product [Spodoptera exigua]|nr:unnamed protein product [Spodoptera exigua]